MSKFDQRFSGYAWTCDGCSKRIRCETLFVLDMRIDAHLVKCVAGLKKRQCTAAQSEFPFGPKR